MKKIETLSGFTISWSISESHVFLMDKSEDSKLVEIEFFDPVNKYSKELKIHILEGVIKALKKL